MVISSVFELYALSKTQLSKLLGSGAGEVYSINVVAHSLPEDGKRVLWISRTSEIEVGTYLAKFHRVDLLPNLGFGGDSLLRTVSAFHFWIDVENPEVFSHSFSKIKTGVMNHADPVVSQVQDAFFDLFSRIMQYLGPNNCPPENRKMLFVDQHCAYHLGYYVKQEDGSAAVSLCDSDAVHPVEDYTMWSDLQLEGLEHLLKLGNGSGRQDNY